MTRHLTGVVVIAVLLLASVACGPRPTPSTQGKIISTIEGLAETGRPPSVSARLDYGKISEFLFINRAEYNQFLDAYEKKSGRETPRSRMSTKGCVYFRCFSSRVGRVVGSYDGNIALVDLDDRHSWMESAQSMAPPPKNDPHDLGEVKDIAESLDPVRIRAYLQTHPDANERSKLEQLATRVEALYCTLTNDTRVKKIMDHSANRLLVNKSQEVRKILGREPDKINVDTEGKRVKLIGCTWYLLRDQELVGALSLLSDLRSAADDDSEGDIVAMATRVLREDEKRTQ